MDELETRIARLLAKRALRASLTTYPMLAEAVGWYNRTGQGLGRPLAGVLQFCDRNSLPMLTSIVCATGTNSPSLRGVAAMEQELSRPVDIPAEQEAVFRFDWKQVDLLDLEVVTDKPTLRHLYAAPREDFQPEQQGVYFFPSAVSRDVCLGMMDGKTISIVQVDSSLEGAGTGGGRGRLAGIAEVAPIAISSSEVSGLRRTEGGVRYGIPIRRAWRFVKPPLAVSTLTDSWEAGYPASSAELVKLSARELAEISQHTLVEVPVSGQARYIPPYVPPAPAIHTYMVVCHDLQALRATNVKPGQRLVKIGVSNDKERRLQELNGNHIAVICGISFHKYSEGTWSSQYEALQVERRAHEWCHVNGQHASGEYFYLREDQLAQAGAIVFKG